MVDLKEVMAEEEFEQLLSQAADSTTLVLNFHTTWASPCWQMRTVLSALASSYPDSSSSSSPQPVTFLSLDAEKFPDISERYEVSAVPFLVLLQGGKVVETVSGSDAAQVREAVERHAGKPGAAANKNTGAGTQLPPPQKVEKPSSNPNGAVKNLSSYAPKSDDPKTAPEMTGKTFQQESSSTSTSTSDNSSTKEELHTRLQALVSAAPVMLFIKGTPSVPQCGFSRQLVGLLRERGVRYGFFNILADEEVRQGLKEYSDWPTFPQLYADGELVGGLDIVSPHFLIPISLLSLRREALCVPPVS